MTCKQPSKEAQPQPLCPHCGCIHLGQRFDDCPNTRMKPCEICGTPTLYCCSDCQIERRETVHVCVASACRDAHEAKHPEHPNLVPQEVQALWQARCPHDKYGSVKQFACPQCVARLLDSERAKARQPILDLQLFYDQLVDGQIIKESDGEPWPLTKSEAEQICKALQQRISIVWPRRALEQAADRKV